MLAFDLDRFLRIQAGALALEPDIGRAVAACLEAGAENLFFLGTGGAAILMQPAAQLLQRQSSFPTFMEISAELTAAGHAALGQRSIAVIPSLSGTTRESVAALEYCKARGATVLALTGDADSPLAKDASRAFVNFAEDDTSSESFYLRRAGAYSGYDATVAELRRLPKLLAQAKQNFDGQAEALARRLMDEPYHIITAAGSCWPQAWYYGMCILEEMQWIRTRPVHASDFFHGTLELVEKGVSVMVLKGEDAYRPLAERAERFAAEHTDKLTVLDTAAVPLDGISPKTRALISPIVLASLLERLSAHLAVLRGHPLTVRRYYKRVQY
jgi:fructoselysine-6-phosphate deglycase